MKLRTTLMAAVAALGLTTAANAAPFINGSYTLTVAQVTADTVDLSKASAIYFTGGILTAPNVISTFTPIPGFVPASVTACANCGSIFNITGIPAGSATTPFSGIDPLFKVGNLSFDLDSLTAVIRTSTASNSSLEIKGTGTYIDTLDGYANTAGTFDITVQNGSVTIQADSASASGTAFQATPEPASIALLGGALAAVGFVRRRKNG